MYRLKNIFFYAACFSFLASSILTISRIIWHTAILTTESPTPPPVNTDPTFLYFQERFYSRP